MNGHSEKSYVENQVLNAMLLPMADVSLLVPMSAIAEIVSGELSVDIVDATDQRFFGWIHWRDQRLPLISFEGLAGNAHAPITSNCRIAVLNAVGPAAQRGYYAIMLNWLPRPLRMYSLEDTFPVTAVPNKVGVLCEARLAGESVMIPDFDFLENLSLELRDGV
ncbi:MAG TPA: hypothetical protein DCZ13_11700 [Porticoccaceae bacterium]|nr:hypothetical protein [Porticoccaceae bacterium]